MAVCKSVSSKSSSSSSSNFTLHNSSSASSLDVTLSRIGEKVIRVRLEFSLLLLRTSVKRKDGLFTGLNHSLGEDSGA